MIVSIKQIGGHDGSGGLHRLEHAKPLVEQFFAWVDEQLARQGLLPSNKLTQALAYARERKAQLIEHEH